MAHNGSGVSALTSVHRHSSRAYVVSGVVGGGLPVIGAKGWWDATQLTGLADGASLTTWTDFSGNGFPLNVVAGTGPTYYKTTAANLINNKPTVAFGGAGGIQSNAAGIMLAQPFTVMVVFKYTSLATQQYLFSSATSAAVAIFNSTTSVDVTAGSGTTFGTLNTTGPHMVVFAANGASSLAQLDGTSSGTLSSGATALATHFEVGDSDGNVSLGLNGLIGEVALWPSALTGTQMNSLRSYCQTKWGTP